MDAATPRPLETSPVAPMGVVVPPRRNMVDLSPINRRRWKNFKANRRGWWSFWIFLVLFVLTLGAEFIANNKPFYVSFDGRSYFPVFTRYTETAFGGDFETEADYRDPYLQKLIAEKGGYMIWPPIRYSYSTPQSRSADAGALEAHLAADRGAVPDHRREEGRARLPRAGMELARHRRPGPRRRCAPDLWLPPLGVVRAGADADLLGDRRDRGSGAGLFRRLDRSLVPALHRNLDLDSGAVSAAHHLLGAGAGLLRVAGNSSAFLVGCAGRPGAGRVSARAQFRICAGRARARRVQHRAHVPPPAAERHGRDAHLPALHPFELGDDADRAGLSRFRPAARLALARRDAGARQIQHSGALAGAGRLLHGRDPAFAPDLHRRGRARRLRPRKTFA